MQPLNVLMLGGAKRVSMARLFTETAAKLKYNARMYSFELGEDVPIASVAEVITGGKWTRRSRVSFMMPAWTRKST